MLVDKDVAFSPWCSPVKPIGCVHVAPIEERKGEGGWVGMCVCVCGLITALLQKASLRWYLTDLGQKNLSRDHARNYTNATKLFRLRFVFRFEMI